MPDDSPESPMSVMHHFLTSMIQLQKPIVPRILMVDMGRKTLSRDEHRAAINGDRNGDAAEFFEMMGVDADPAMLTDEELRRIIEDLGGDADEVLD